MTGRVRTAVEVLHLDAHTGHACVFSEPTCCPYYDQALDILDALHKAGFAVINMDCPGGSDA